MQTGRAWARELGVSHTWLQKVVKELRADPGKMRELQAYGDPRLVELTRAREYSREMRARGELRSYRSNQFAIRSEY